MKYSIFSNLCYGIYSVSIGEDQPFTIENTQFRDNLRGIYASGIDEISVTLSEFQTYNFSGEMPENYGMFLENCSGYQIEENYFHNVNEEKTGNGLVISNSGVEPNEVYNNRFDKLEYGIIAQYRNRNESGNEGLQILCNEFTNGEYDIAITGEGESPYLGVKKNQGSNGSFGS